MEKPEKPNPTPEKIAKTVIVEAIEKIPPVSGDMEVSLKRTSYPHTDDMALWVVIRNSTEAISFENYKNFVNNVMCRVDETNSDSDSAVFNDKLEKMEASQRDFPLRLPFPGVSAYTLLKVATEIFMMVKCGVALGLNSIDIPEERNRFNDNSVDDSYIRDLWDSYLGQVTPKGTIPYLALIHSRLSGVPVKTQKNQPDLEECYGILEEKLTNPCLLELIWSYWQEEGMLIQAMNAVSMRFQNKRLLANADPISRLDTDPLRPLSNLIWGHIQDTQHRLDIPRRAYEYDHHYGLRLYGKAVPSLRSVDSRSKFLEAFHNLLYLCSVFYRDDDDTTIIADSYPVLNALKEVHLLLAQGMHNQYGDLPSNARMEMMMQQWILARPEMREFLGGRIMVPYPERWMDRVDNIKNMYGWTDVTVTHFNYLAVFGECILLSIRFGNWIKTNDRIQAANWARYWRTEIQGYIHNYRAVTGVDLASESQTGRVDSTMPSVHLKSRLAAQKR